MTTATVPCVVCGTDASVKAATGDFIAISCPDCGDYQASGSYRAAAPEHTMEVRRRSLRSARMRGRYGQPVRMTTYDLP